MRDDRYLQHQKLFIFGIICLVTCLGLLFFSVYILPFLFWDTNYGVPYFVSNMIAYYHDTYDYSSAGSKTIVELYFLIPGIIAGVISYFISNYIENQVFIEKPQEEEEKEKTGAAIRRDIQASAGIGLKIFFLMVLVVAGLLLIQFILFG